jgi:hypothetical protein
MDLAPARFRARECVASALQRAVWSRSSGDRSQRESMPGRQDRGDSASIPAVRNSLIDSIASFASLGSDGPALHPGGQFVS